MVKHAQASHFYIQNDNPMLTQTEINALNQYTFSQVVYFELDNSCEIKLNKTQDILTLHNICLESGCSIDSVKKHDVSGFHEVLRVNVDPDEVCIQHFILNRIKDIYPEFWNFWVNGDVEDIYVSFKK